MDEYTEQTTQGLGSRLMESIKGVAFGFILFLVAFPVLWFNEGYAVKTARSLTQGAHDVVSAAIDKIDPAHEGKLVHVTGQATTSQTVTDPTFGVSANAIKIRRKVETYQWQESKSSRKQKNFGGSETTTTTYSYAQVWSEQAIDSSRFKQPQGHQNPTPQFASATYAADGVKLGAFRLTGSIVSQLTTPDPVDISAAKLPDSIQSRAHPIDSGFQIGDPASPQVGDLRVTFTQLKPTDVSVVARQISDTFEPYRAAAGGTIELVAMGVQGADTMFASAKSENAVRTWIFRAVGLLVMFFGLMLVLNPLSTLADVLPFIGSLLRVGAGLLSGAVAICLSLLTVAIAWITYRPVVAIGLLAVAALVFYGVTRLRKPSRKPVPVSV